MPTDRDALSSSLPSSVVRLLSTNEPPSDVELPLIRRFLANGPARMDGLNAQIDRLSTTLARLISERDGLAEDLQKYPTLLAPVRRVPYELVCEIFSWTLPYTRKPEAERNTVIHRPPLYLGHICGTWRDIAINFPPLWTTITVYHSNDHPICRHCL
ncbi:hypothetical protein DFH06DRAFT_1102817 [Mycena polygramma]|nr:hypothetical protein DFH06DRAFT_1102817 [Mycena polygramma]